MALLLPASASLAAGATGGFSAPSSGARLDAGRQIEIRWEGIPDGVEEMELLVSLDGSRRFARVVDLEPTGASYIWQVPSLPTEHAVLAIRGRVDEREILLLESGAFSIEQKAGDGLQALSYHGGELWTDTAGSSTPPSNSGLTSPSAACGMPAADTELEDVSSFFSCFAPALLSLTPCAPLSPTEGTLSPTLSRAPFTVPLRN